MKVPPAGLETTCSWFSGTIGTNYNDELTFNLDHLKGGRSPLLASHPRAFSPALSLSACIARFLSIARALGAWVMMLNCNSSAIWEDSLCFQPTRLRAQARKAPVWDPAARALSTASPVFTYSWMKVFCLCVVCGYFIWGLFAYWWLSIFNVLAAPASSAKIIFPS